MPKKVTSGPGTVGGVTVGVGDTVAPFGVGGKARGGHPVNAPPTARVSSSMLAVPLVSAFDREAGRHRSHAESDVDGADQLVDSNLAVAVAVPNTRGMEESDHIFVAHHSLGAE